MNNNKQVECARQSVTAGMGGKKQKNAPSKFKKQITTRTRNRKETDPEKCWRDDICDMHIRV